MKTHYLLLVATFIALSANADSSQRTRTVSNPITIESQIKDVSIDGDTVTIHLYRQPYDFVVAKWVRVRALDGQRLYAEDLEAGDNVHVEGDLDHTVVCLRHITLQLRVVHLR